MNVTVVEDVDVTIEAAVTRRRIKVVLPAGLAREKTKAAVLDTVRTATRGQEIVFVSAWRDASAVNRTPPLARAMWVRNDLPPGALVPEFSAPAGSVELIPLGDGVARFAFGGMVGGRMTAEPLKGRTPDRKSVKAVKRTLSSAERRGYLVTRPDNSELLLGQWILQCQRARRPVIVVEHHGATVNVMWLPGSLKHLDVGDEGFAKRIVATASLATAKALENGATWSFSASRDVCGLAKLPVSHAGPFLHQLLSLLGVDPPPLISSNDVLMTLVDDLIREVDEPLQESA